MRKTNHFLDCIKGIACIGVVLIHVHFPTIMGNVIDRFFQFAVPIFFMTSGYFIYSQDRMWIAKTLRRRTKRILWLSVWSTSLYWGIKALHLVWKDNCTLGGDGIEEGVRRLIRFILLQDVDFSGGPHLWFLWALLWSYLMLIIINRYGLWKEVHRCLPLLLANMIILFLLRDNYGLSWHSTCNAVVGVTYVLIGNFLAEYRNCLHRYSNSLLIALIFLGEFLNLTTFLHWEFDFSRIGITLVAVSLFVLSIKNKNAIIINVWQKIEIIGFRYSLNIYVFHMLVMMALERIIGLAGLNGYILVLVLKPFLVVLVSIVVAIMIEGIFKTVQQNKEYNLQKTSTWKS